MSTPLLLRGGLLQPLALLEGGMLQPRASLEGEPPQIHEQELLQLHALLLWEPPLVQPLALWEPTLIQK